MYTPNAVCNTDLTAEENMWVTGEVTLMLSRPAMQMRKPVTPCVRSTSRSLDSRFASEPLGQQHKYSHPANSQ